MERRQPYSHRASLMFCVMEIRSRKNEMKRAITATIPTKMFSTMSNDSRASTISTLERTMSDLPRLLRTPFKTNSRFYLDMSGLILINNLFLGIPSTHS